MIGWAIVVWARVEARRGRVERVERCIILLFK